jgi:hypothetical protein
MMVDMSNERGAATYRNRPLISLVASGVMLVAAGAISWTVGVTQLAQDTIRIGQDQVLGVAGLSDPAIDADKAATYWGIALVIGGAVLLTAALIVTATHRRKG